MSAYSGYSVEIADGNNDPGGAENLRQAAEKQFPGLTATIRESSADPSGIILGGPDGPNADTRNRIKLWLEMKRETFC